MGLYMVETNDTTLMHGDNIYSNLIEAKQNKIKFKVTHELIPKKRKGATPMLKGFFKPILDAIILVSDGNKAMVKKLNNILSGMLGKDQQHTTKVLINSDIEQVWNWFHKKGYNNESKIFVRNMAVGEQLFYLHGKEEHFQLSEVNLAMYIQIKDFANMRLFRMIKEM